MEKLEKTENSAKLERIEELNDKIFKQLKKARSDIKNDRKNFWNKNSVNFRNNLKNLIEFFKFPEKWGVSIVASRFLLNKHVMPYDQEVWSFSDVVCATENMGYEIIIFFNKTDLEFLSSPALLPIVVHEVKHVFQAAENPAKYVTSTVDEEYNKKLEKEADKESAKYEDEFRRENLMEKIIYCYDFESWEGATKMADYLYKEAADAFGGGYDQEMKKEEYEVFLEAKEEKDIDIFIDYFIESLDKRIKEREAQKDKEDKGEKAGEKEKSKEKEEAK